MRKLSIFSYQARSDAGERLVFRSLVIWFLTSILVCLVLSLILIIDAQSNEFAVLLYFSPVLALSFIASNRYRATGHLIKSQLTEALFRSMIIIILGGALAFSSASLDLVVMAFAMSAMISTVVIFWGINIVPTPGTRSTRPLAYRYLLKAGFPFSLITIMQGLKNYGDLFVVGLFLQQDSVAQYSIALQLVTLIAFAQMLISLIISRRLAWALKNRHVEKITQLLGECKIYSLIFGIAVLGTIGIFGDSLLTTHLGDGYSDVIPLFLILASGRLIHLSVGPVMQVLALSNNQVAAAKATFISGILNLVIGITLVFNFGIFGAAVSGAISISIWAILLKIRVSRVLLEMGH